MLLTTQTLLIYTTISQVQYCVLAANVLEGSASQHILGIFQVISSNIKTPLASSSSITSAQIHSCFSRNPITIKHAFPTNANPPLKKIPENLKTSFSFGANPHSPSKYCILFLLLCWHWTLTVSLFWRWWWCLLVCGWLRWLFLSFLFLFLDGAPFFDRPQKIISGKGHPDFPLNFGPCRRGTWAAAPHLRCGLILMSPNLENPQQNINNSLQAAGWWELRPQAMALFPALN